jgi:hypothetical protein
VLLVITVEYAYRQRRLMPPVTPRVAPLGSRDGFMALVDACREVNNRVEDGATGRFIRRNWSSVGDQLNVLARYIADTTVALFGRRPASTELRQIDKSILPSATFKAAASELWLFDGRAPEYVGLSIREADLPQAVREIEAANNAPVNPVLTLRDRFNQDFTHLFRIHNQLTVRSVDDGNAVNIDCLLYLDHAANSDFVSLYVPHCEKPVEVCQHLATQISTIRDQLKARIIADARSPGDVQSVRSSQLRFSGRVFVYHEDDLTLQQLAELEQAYSQNGLAAHFRGPGFAATRGALDESGQ